ncbi:MAG TPA: hypothetical protein VFP80_03590 [Thermoanaerobaculia bacterium]|nr:hypothetical protein [Thermoanaerobaculia bacterium]
MKNLRALLLLAIIAATGSSFAHPGSAIAAGRDGRIYFVDTGAGVFSVDAAGRVVRREGPAFHWFALDPDGRFRNTPWPSMPGAEFRSADVSLTVVLSSDYPVAIGGDGKFYFPDGRSGDRVRLVAVDPSGARTIRATLPVIRRAGEAVPWLNGLAPGPGGSLYYTEDRAIRKVDARGQVSTVVANVALPKCAAIPGAEAVAGPYLRGLAVAGDGTVYVAASNCGALLKVDPKGQVRTVLTTEAPWSPTAVALAGNDVYVLEYLHTASDERREWLPRIRKISPSGQVTLIVPSGTTRK